MPRSRGEEQAEPLHVVVRVQQRRDLLFDRAVRPRVDVADVHGATERSRKGRRRDVGFPAAAADDESLATPGGQLIAPIDRHRTSLARGHAQPAADAAAAVEPQAPAVRYRQRAREARRGERQRLFLADRIGIE